MLSRAKQHGLQRHPPWLLFDFTEEGMEVRAALEAGELKYFSFPTAELTSEVEALLKQFQDEEID